MKQKEVMRKEITELRKLNLRLKNDVQGVKDATQRLNHTIKQFELVSNQIGRNLKELWKKMLEA